MLGTDFVAGLAWKQESKVLVPLARGFQKSYEIVRLSPPLQGPRAR